MFSRTFSSRAVNDRTVADRYPGLRSGLRIIVLLLMLSAIKVEPVFSQGVFFPVREQSGGRLNAVDLVVNPTTTGFNPDTLAVANDKRSQMTGNASAFSSKVKYKSNNTLVKFGIDHSATNPPQGSYVYKLVYKLEGSKDMNSPTFNVPPIIDTLVISYQYDSLSTIQDLQVKAYPGYYNAKLSVINIYDITGNLNAITLPNPLLFPIQGPTNFYIELGMQYQAFSRVPNTPAQMGLSLNHIPDLTTQTLKVTWAPQNLTPYLDKVTPAQYELEWTYVDNYPANGTTPLSAGSLQYNFKNNATRIITDSLNYSIPLVYPKGYIVYRARMIRVDEVQYKNPIYGDWSLPATGTVGSTNNYEITAPHTGDAINWNYTIHFAEGGKYKHVVSYFDGMLKNRQTITRFNSNPKQLLVTENIYDYEGRPAITTLPSVIDTNAFTYQHGVSISDATNDIYNAADFDIKPAFCPDSGIIIPKFKPSSLANRYYSTLNTDTGGMQKYVPQAGGYPFVHTQLSPGFSDRVDKMGGAGDKLQIGMGHETVNEYVNADQPDLNQLFGINVGYKNFYTKTVSTDPNGQMSMSVKDYEGKLMTTSLIGATIDTNSTAIMFNDEVPNAALFNDDQLANSPQLTVGHERKYNGNFYMDFRALTRVKYEYTFKPFQVCPAPNYLGLMVDGKYDYTITDKCGIQKLHKFGTIGTTGVTTDPSDKVATTVTDTVLEKGKYTLDKTLSINTDDIYAAVDSFFVHTPNCARTEDDFIHEEVLKEHFPCPDSLLDPCAALQKAMMEELFPINVTHNIGIVNSLTTGKYGTFTRANGPMAGVTPSIFDFLGGEQSINLYRYQSPCVARELDSIQVRVYGNTYSVLGNLPVDTFEFIYEHAQGNDKYAIAHALLPLHPEFCRLKGCFIDTFETRLNSIPNATVAMKYGFFDLDSLVNKDIQLRQKVIAASPAMQYISDSLKVMLNGYVRMDTFAAEMAFCLNDDSLVFGDAKRFFHQQIVQLDFPSMGVRDVYFNKLRAFYINNRNKYKSIAQTGGGNNCEPCDTNFRMHLKPPPLVTVIYNPNGTFATGPGSLLSLFSGSTLSSLTAALYIPTQSSNQDTVAAYRDTATRGMQHIDSLLSYIAVDSVMSRMVNCISNSSMATALRSKLVNMVADGEVHNGIFLPEQIRAAIVSAGIPLNDLCHPYLLNYDYYDDGLGARGSCSSGGFYTSVQNFLNDAEIMTQLRATTTIPSTYDIDINSWPQNDFADKMLAKMNGTDNKVKLVTSYDALRKLYHLSFYRLGNANGDTVNISLRSPVTIGVGGTQYPLLQATATTTTLRFSNIACYYEDPQAYAEGHIGRYEFRATVDRTDGTQNTRTEMLGWNNGKIYMNQESGGNSIASCVPCTQFKTIYKAFADSMQAYGGYAADHPLFMKSLRNFMNYNLKKVFGEDQYSRFLQSCALADSMAIPAYGYTGYGSNKFSSLAAFAQFKQDIYAADSFSLKTLINYNDGYQRVIFDYSNIPFSLLRKFNQQVISAGGTIHPPIPGTIGALWLPNNTPAPAMAAINIVIAATGFSVNNSTPVSVYRANNNSTYIRNDLVANGSLTNAQVSSSLAAVQQSLYDNNIQGYWLPTRFATVNQDYNTPEKKQLLAYTYGLEAVSNMTTPKVLDTLQGYLLRNNITAFAGSDVTYNDPANPYRFTNLYFTNSANVYPGYAKLKNILGYAQSALSNSSLFIPANATNNTVLASGSPGGGTLTLYRCADGLYWYRYFDANLKLYNIFVRMPKYVFKNAQPSYNLLGVTPGTANIVPDNGDSATHRFTLKLSNGIDTITAVGSTSFDIAWSHKLSDVLLGNEDNFLQEDPASGEVGAPNNCEQTKLANAIYAGKIRYINYIDSFRTHLKTAFYAHVMSQIKEKLWIQYVDRRFATTLYNYDLAGNLIQTVPPEGVHKLSTTAAATVDALRAGNQVASTAIPADSKVTQYEYNTANKPLIETTPDAGQKLMYYDAKGNVILSQTAQQRVKGTYTYMLYDGQNRVMETGEVHWGTCPGFIDTRSWNLVNGVWTHRDAPYPGCSCETKDSMWQYCATAYIEPYITSYDNAAFDSVIRRMPRTQVVVSIYDDSLINLSAIPGMSKQENLRNRIAANLYYENCGVHQDFRSGYVHATHYSYDVTGNVQTLVQDFPELDGMQQRYKRVDYEYDLLSGKVNMVAYNRGASDQFYQQYSYDADNRITQVRTSHDGIIWKRDAEYTYYKHGPLARVSLGDQRVQGIDYAYTLQGWLKTINGDAADTSIDLGGDGRKGTGVTPKDIYATSIDYFNGDYTPIGGIAITNLPGSAKNLYNGNIARQTTDVAPFGGLTTAYTYDQLNRIRYANNATRTPTNTLAFSDWYASSYKYDMDGNLKALTRKDKIGLQLDDLTYVYPNAGQDNKLADVLEAANITHTGVEDLKPWQPAPGIIRMLYDADGNLIKDLTSATDTVQWNIYGKTTDIVNKTAKLNLHFIYDGAGQRVSKNQTINTDTGHINQNTYYVRDATGNILAEYNTRQVYNNGGGRLGYYEPVKWTGEVALDPHILLHAIHELSLDLRDDFTAAIMEHTGGTTTIPHQAGYYLYRDPALLQQFLSNNINNVLPALCNYSNSTGHNPLGESMLLAINQGEDRQLSDLSSSLFTQRDPDLRSHVLTQLAITMPDIYRGIAAINGIDSISTSEDSLHLAQIMDALCRDNPAWYSDIIHETYLKGVAAPDLPNPVLPWLNAVTTDSTYYNAGDELHMGDLISNLQHNLVRYGIEQAAAEAGYANDTDVTAHGFFGFANGLDGSMAMINEIVPEDHLEQIDYSSDPVSYLTALVATDPNVLDDALDRMGDGLDGGALYNSISQAALLKNVPVGNEPERYNGGGPVLKSQQIDLASHHIYGSSRIGIAGYWPGQYARIWDNVAQTVDTMRLRGNQPWYSYSYNDVIEPGKTSVFGNGLISTNALAQHVLGQKQYELTNYLGNVQSTVSDRRFVKASTGSTPVFSAGVVAAYDYFPFGMLMPGRFVQDTDKHEATISQVVLTPQIGTLALGLTNAATTTPWVQLQQLSSPSRVLVSGASGGVAFPFTAVVGQPVTAVVQLSNMLSWTLIGLEEYVNGSWIQRRSLAVNTTNPTPLPAYTATVTNMRVTVQTYVSWATNQPSLFTVSGVSLQTMTMVPQTMVVTINNKGNDKYEFGFNGQMKLNEIAGTGNWNSAEFWEYGTREATRKNIDPVVDPSQSPYSVFDRNPIAKNDVKGDAPCCETATQILQVKAAWQENTINWGGGPIDGATDAVAIGEEVVFDVAALGAAAWEWMNEAPPTPTIRSIPATPPAPTTRSIPAAPPSKAVPSSTQASTQPKLQNRAASSAAAQLPKLKGKSVPHIEKTLQKNGFTLSKKSSTGNATWDHADGSQARVHPYGNQKQSPHKSGNNAHSHKQDPSGNQLDDNGDISTDPNETHIGGRNPKNLPSVRGRPHGA